MDAVCRNATLALFIMDDRQQCVYMNPAAERLTGYTLAEVRGRPLHDVVHHTRPDGTPYPLAECPIDRAFPTRNQVQGEEVFVHKGGHFYPVAFTASPIRDGGAVAGTVVEVRDISREKEAAERLREEARVADTLHRVGAALAAELDLTRIVQLVTDEATRLTGAQFGAFFYNVPDGRGGSYVLYTLSGVPREAFADFPMPRNTAVFGPTFNGEGTVRLGDVTTDPRYGRNAPYRGMPEGHLPVRSYLAVSVKSRSGEVLGGLFFGHPDAGVFSARHERLAEGVAAHAAVAIDNARLYESARRERERAEAGERSAKFLADASSVLAELVDYESTLRTVAWLAVPRFADWSAVDLAGDGGALRRLAVAHVDPDRVDLARDLDRRFPPDPAATHGAYHVLRTGEPELMEDIPDGVLEAVARSDEHLGILRDLGLRSYLCVPLAVRGRTIGVITFVSAESGRRYGPAELAVATDLANRAAVAIDNAWLLDQTRRTAETLTRQLEYTRAVTDSLGEGLYAVDAAGAITAVNPAAERLLGWRADELIGRNAHDAIHRSVRPDGTPVPAGECPLLAVRRSGVAYRDDDDTFVRKDGRRVPVAYTSAPVTRGGTVDGAVVVFQDVTERKAEAARAGRRAGLVALRGEVAAALAGGDELRAVLGRCAEAIVRHLHAAFARVWTVSADGSVLELQASAGLYTHTDGPHARVPVGMYKIGRIAQERKPHLTNDVPNDPRVSNQEWARREGMAAFAGYPLVVDDRLVGVVALFAREPLAQDTLDWLASVADLIAQGVTRRQAEAEVRRLNEGLERMVAERTARLEEANRELEAFSYSVSHDLRAPLRHIGGFVQRLMKTAAPAMSDADRRHLGIVQDAARQAGRMIDDLLAFSRMGRAELQRTLVDTAAVVEQVRREAEADAGGRPVEWRVGPLPAVRADPSMLKQVWRNLLSNAVKYTRPAAAPVVEVRCETTAAEHVFRVRDNGVGFDQQYAGKLFGVFQRLHTGEEFEGTGIGLANVRRIVARHGGRTWAEGEEGRGATFSFTLPRHEGDT